MKEPSSQLSPGYFVASSMTSIDAMQCKPPPSLCTFSNQVRQGKQKFDFPGLCYPVRTNVEEGRIRTKAAALRQNMKVCVDVKMITLAVDADPC